MLEKLDLSKKVSKEDYNRQMDVLGERLGKAQRMARDAKDRLSSCLRAGVVHAAVR